MVLIIGGAYQGKLDYALDNYKCKKICSLTSEDVSLDMSAEVFNSFHLLVLAQLRSGIDTTEYLKKVMPCLADKIIICDDISSGVVPIDPEMRRWREAVGSSLALLARDADEVIRVFCGIGKSWRQA